MMYASTHNPKSATPIRTMELQQGILYGPLQSRRLGLSLGINLLPESFKLCSLNCCYCQYGWTHQTFNDGRRFADILPSPTAVEQAVVSAFEQSIKFDYLTLCGNGEPTLHPQFNTVVERLCMLRQSHNRNFKIAVISNSTTCFLENIKETLSKVDMALMKLDVGNELMFRKLNGGSKSIAYESILTGLKNLDKYIIQSMFVDGAINNSSDEEIDSWLTSLENLQPQCVQVYSLARPAASRKINQVKKGRLEEIAELGRLRTGFEFEVF